MIVERKNKIVVIERQGAASTIGGIKRISRAELLNQLTMRRMFDKKRCAEFYGVGIVPELIQTISVTERNRHSRVVMYGGKRRWTFAEFSQPWWRYKRGFHRQAFSGQIQADLMVRFLMQSEASESSINVG